MTTTTDVYNKLIKSIAPLEYQHYSRIKVRVRLDKVEPLNSTITVTVTTYPSETFKVEYEQMERMKAAIRNTVESSGRSVTVEHWLIDGDIAFSVTNRN